MQKNKIFRLPRRAKGSPLNDRYGFTLSETLLTLAIMGTLMAITIPALVSSTNNKAYVAGLQKTYAILDTATNQLLLNNSGTMKQNFTTATSITKKYGTVLEYAKLCTSNAAGNCWPASSDKLSGGAAVEGFDATTISIYRAAVLPDGTCLLFVFPFPSGIMSCSRTGLSPTLPYDSASQNLCGYIYADVNGFREPNTFGKDQFVFVLGSNGLYPGGDPHTHYNDLSLNCSTTDLTHNGYGCASKVLNESAINY